MESFDNVREFWQHQTNQEENPTSVSKTAIEKVIRTRMKKERKNIAEYFWTSFGFQILLYSFASFMIVKFWYDRQIVLMSAAGVLLYIPFTIILMRKFKAMFKITAGQTANIQSNTSNHYKLLNQFFSFKKKFDLVGVPVNCFILVGILFKLYVPGGLEANVVAGIISFAGMVSIFSIATWLENKKHFSKPLRRIELILRDMELTG